MPFVKGASQTVLELADRTVFALHTRPLSLDEKAAKALSAEVIERLARLAERLAAAPDWTVTALETLLKQFAEDEGVGMGKFGPGLRAALSGGSPAPDLAGALATLGRDESLGRLQDALSRGA